MPGGRRVEHNMVVPADHIIVGQECGELIKGGDLRCAGAGQLLLDAFERLLRQNPAHGADDALAVLGGRFLRIDFNCIEAGNLRDRCDAVADLRLEHLTDVGCRIGADEQDLLALVGKAQRRGAGQRRLPDPAFAGEEDEFRKTIEHGARHSLPPAPLRGRSTAA